MEREWALAAFPLETSVLKLRLRPYSCGHEILLCQIDSPLILGGKAEWLDLFCAALICSQTFDEGRNLIVNPAKVKWFARIWKIWLRFDSLKLEFEFAKMRRHLESGSWSPPTNELKHGWTSRTLKAPRAYRLIPLLCSQLNLTEAEALDFPLSRANAYSAALADKDGTIDLQGGEADNALIDHLAELEERAKKGEKVWDF